VLKTLEEPPGHTVFCLVTAAPAELRETIISRCRRIDIDPVPRAEIEAALIGRGIAPAVAARAAEESRGRPARAIRLAADPDEMGLQGRRLEHVTRIAAEGTAERFREANSLAERFRKDRGPVLAELDVWEMFWETRLRLGAAEGATREALAGYLAALNAVRQVREDLMANVIPRTAFELMLLSFPRVTLAVSPEEEPVAYA
jgi:DNA polymerase-3 subunit delta'